MEYGLRRLAARVMKYPPGFAASEVADELGVRDPQFHLRNRGFEAVIAGGFVHDGPTVVLGRVPDEGRVRDAEQEHVGELGSGVVGIGPDGPAVVFDRVRTEE